MAGKLGRLVWTRGVNQKIAEDAKFAGFVLDCLKRHGAGGWGDLGDEDKKANDAALRDGGRLLSAYEQKGLPKIWIITEWDRSVTTVLFPDEY